MSDAFFTNPRPFTKRKREDGPNFRSGTDSRRGARAPTSSSSRGASSRGAPRGARGSTRGARGGREAAKGKRRAVEDEELDDQDGEHEGAFDSDEHLPSADEIDSDDGEDEAETPAQKRLRLSQMYLKSLEKEARPDDGGFDAADLDRDLIAERLQQDVLEHSGKLHLSIADSLVLPIAPSSIHLTPSKGHRGPVTSAIASSDGSWLYTSSKDGSIIKWSLTAALSGSGRIAQAVYFPKRPTEDKTKEGKGKAKAFDAGGHTDEVLALALSDDGKTLASGGKDKVVGVWNVEGESGSWTRGLGGHKDKVAAIAFRLGTLQLYSSSFDRTLKVYDLATLSYVETLLGHQDCIQSVSALRGELALSAGGRDKTIRYWKVAEESQLVFRGGVASRIRNVLDGAMEEDGVEQPEERRRRAPRGEVKYVEGSVDCVAMVDDTTFVSGGDSGSLCLWTTTKKKPIATVQLAHGVTTYASASEGDIGTARWITALACLPYGDTFASGSWDGSIRLWKIDDRVRSFSALATIPAVGYINSLQLLWPSLAPAERARQGNDDKALVVVAAVAKEPRLGRWMRIKDGREGALVAVVRVKEGETLLLK